MIVVVCGSLELAEYLFEIQEFDCLLLDFHLIDGVAQGPIERLRAAAGNPHLPVILMSSYGTEEKAADALVNGASDYLAKNQVTSGALKRSIENCTVKARLAISLDMERQSLRKANDALTRKGREIQSFYHTVSHELKTPLTAIREFCALVHDEVLGPALPAQVDAMQTALKCCDRLSHLVNDLFDAARVETGKLELHRSITDISALLKDELLVQKTWISDHHLSLVTDIDKQIPHLAVDPARIRQVVSNLIRNAVKFTDAGGQIRVSAMCSIGDGVVALEVADNGYGIEAEHAPFIFDRLYQVDAHGQSSQNGMGIGLYLCSQIIRQHGGSISVRSQFGEGSTFRIELPISRGVAA